MDSRAKPEDDGDRGHAPQGFPLNRSAARTLSEVSNRECEMDFLIQAEEVLHSEVGFGTMFARLASAAVLGLFIGLDREYKNHPAGMRTHMLVSLASATFTVLTFELIARVQGDAIQSDPVRAIGAVTAGVAFLAAGTIIQGRQGVQGLTTGAGMWLAGAIGLACGLGAFGIALTVTALGMFIMTMLGWLTPYIPKQADDEPAKPARSNRAKGRRPAARQKRA